MARKKSSLPDQLFSEPGDGGAEWENRIVRFDPAAAVSQLVPHELNFRVHNGFQTRAMKGVLEHVGMVAPVKVSVRTGKLLNGHLRVKILQELGVQTVPASYVDVTEAEEARILATLDTLARFARANIGATEALLNRISPTNTDVAALLIHIAGEANVPVPERIAQRYVDLADESAGADLAIVHDTGPDAGADVPKGKGAGGADGGAREGAGDEEAAAPAPDFAPLPRGATGATEQTVRTAAKKALDRGGQAPMLIGTKTVPATEIEAGMFRDVVKHHISQTGLASGLASLLLSFHFDLDAIDEAEGTNP